MNRRPLQDLAKQNKALLPEYRAVFEAFATSGRYVSGPLVAKFESEFADYCGTKHCVTVNTGTAALEVALRGAGISTGQRVAVPAMTFVATAQAVTQAGAMPVLVDVDPDTWTMDPDALSAVATRGIDAVLPVHLHGRLADMEAISSVAREHGALILEDAAQAAGAVGTSGAAGSLSLAGAFSFYPGKNLGALGEGGALVTDDDELAENARLYRNWGAQRRYEHDFPGTNLRMNELMAGLLSVKLPHLNSWIAHRRQAASWYADALGSLPVRMPAPAGTEHAYHVYSIWSEERDALAAALEAEGIEVGIHYPRPIHLNAMFDYLGHVQGDFPVAERLASGYLSLPMDEYITEDEVRRIASCISQTLEISG
jgi:dTDP-4-amino-4,6-dideoxygalactose transaminase